MVASHNYTWQQGEDLVLSMLYKEGPVGAEVAVDLTGYALRMDIVGTDGVRRYTFNSDDIAEAGVDEVGAADNEAVLGADGTINITIPRTLTLPDGELWADINGVTQPATFQYDVFLRNVSGAAGGTIPVGNQKKILKGTVTLEKSVTLWA